ncbi:glutathione reductase, chloroplastic [Tanacetum coccineum]
MESLVNEFASKTVRKYLAKNQKYSSLEVRDFVAAHMSSKAIELHIEESPQAVIKYVDGSFSLKTNKGTTEGFSHVMLATGRKPNTKVPEATFFLYQPPDFSHLEMACSAL